MDYYPYQLGIGILERGDIVSTADQFTMIKNAGYDATFTGWNPARTEAWANDAARKGLLYTSIHAPFAKEYKVSRMWREGEEGVFVTNALIDCVKDCAAHDIPVMVIHPFIGFRDHTPTQVGLDNYARVIEVANKLGVKLGFENVEGEEYLAALMKTFWNEPSLGFCFDTGHELCYNGGKDMMALYGEKLCHTHLNDNLGVYDPTFSIDDTWKNDLHLTMGDGIVDFGRVMQRIDASPYRGPIMCELTRGNKPGQHFHDGYNEMTLEEFYAFTYERAVKVRDRHML